mgnify:CR=1 FL=1
MVQSRRFRTISRRSIPPSIIVFFISATLLVGASCEDATKGGSGPSGAGDATSHVPDAGADTNDPASRSKPDADPVDTSRRRVDTRDWEDTRTPADSGSPEPDTMNDPSSGADTSTEPAEDTASRVVDTGGGRRDTGSRLANCNCNTAVQVVGYLVERGGRTLTVSGLDEVRQDDRVWANLKVKSGCRPMKVSFVSYRASGPTFETSFPLSLYKSAFGSVGGGSKTIGPVDIPNCFFRADLACGRVLTGNELNAGKRYGLRRLDQENCGSAVCGP